MATRILEQQQGTRSLHHGKSGSGMRRTSEHSLVSSRMAGSATVSRIEKCCLDHSSMSWHSSLSRSSRLQSRSSSLVRSSAVFRGACSRRQHQCMLQTSVLLLSAVASQHISTCAGLWVNSSPPEYSIASRTSPPSGHIRFYLASNGHG